MRFRHAALALSLVGVAAVLLCWQRQVHSGSSAGVAPYTAHFTITTNRILADGSSWNSLSSKVLARDRDGRTFEKTGRSHPKDEQKTESYSFFVQDPAKLQTLIWESNGRTAMLGHWPYWSGLVKDAGQTSMASTNQVFRMGENWYKVPESSERGKLETIAEIAEPSGDKRIKTRRRDGESWSERNSRTDYIRHANDYDAARNRWAICLAGNHH